MMRMRDEGPRRSGRTTILTLHFVHLLLDNPGVWVQMDDHHMSIQADHYLMDRVTGVLNVLGIRWDRQGTKIRIYEQRAEIYEYPTIQQCLEAHSEETRYERKTARTPSTVVRYPVQGCEEW